jgi:hypothetical protein
LTNLAAAHENYFSQIRLPINFIRNKGTLAKPHTIPAVLVSRRSCSTCSVDDRAKRRS